SQRFQVSERTLIAVKLDGVQWRLVGQIDQRFDQRGFKLVGMKLLQAREGILSQHYHDLHKKPFYPNLLRCMSSGPAVAMVSTALSRLGATASMLGLQVTVAACCSCPFTIYVSKVQF
ncbi:nucleoside diphosphate kinase, partial [Huso huso]